MPNYPPDLIDTLECRYGTMSFFKNDAVISRSLREYGEWAQNEIDFLSSILSPGCTVFDVGAFIGTHSLAFSRYAGDDGWVYAFEAQPIYCGLLQKNVDLNARRNIHVINAAVGGSLGQLKIGAPSFVDHSNYGGLKLSLYRDPAMASGELVPLITIDSLEPARCDLIKVDVEGMELEVITGAERTLRILRPLVFAECNSLNQAWPVLEYARRLGYICYAASLPAYNQANFRHSAIDIFDRSREAGLFLIPEERCTPVKTRLIEAGHSDNLIPVESIDDLSLVLLKKPQYKYEVLQTCVAAKVIRNDFWANEVEVINLRSESERYHREASETANEAVELRSTVAAMQSTVKDREATLNQIYASRGWKLLSMFRKCLAQVAWHKKVDVNRSRSRDSGTGSTTPTILPGIVTSRIQSLRDMRVLRRAHLFDREWYLQQNPDVAKARVNPLRHYVLHGAHEGRDPNRLFDTDWYLHHNPDVAEASVNPASHYVLHGASEGRDPSPLFDTNWYLEQNPDVANAGQNPLTHYLLHGAAEGRVPSPIYDGGHPGALQGNSGAWTLVGKASTSRRNAEEAVRTCNAYRSLTKQIRTQHRKRLEALKGAKPEVLTLADHDLTNHARTLSFEVSPDIQVSIIIPVYGQLRFTLECLTTIRERTHGVQYEVIVVDDASLDETPEVLPLVANLRYLKKDKNSGFIDSCNLGSSVARGKYVLFLNNDAQVTDGWLRPLVETFSKYDNVGAVGPKVVYPDGRLQEAGVSINGDCTSSLTGLFDDPILPRYNYHREVTYCSGVCLLVETAVFRALGGFDTDLTPAYCEDCDLAFRLRREHLRVFYIHESVIIHHMSVSSRGDTKLAQVTKNQQLLSQKWQYQIDELNKVRIIAMYLPQYHPIPENDRWWGKGFTEWTNVAKSRPNYEGHYQPHVPADLGFYDLRLDEIRREQAELARRYGIAGFCYYYYWFSGHRLLHGPLESVLKGDGQEFPFCIAWANENWTRKWDGREQDILIAQQHSDDDDRRVILDVVRFMRHPSYIRIRGKPLFLVYRISLLPDIRHTVEIWREMCRREGIGEIYLAFVESFEFVGSTKHPRDYGFDASVEFPPHGTSALMEAPGRIISPEYRGVIHDYRKAVLQYLRRDIPGYVRFRAVMPGWDNTPRRQVDPVIFENVSPGAYQAWLEAILDETRDQNFGDERIVFVNAWNEWGEGNHLEPDQRHGHGFLEATLNAQQSWLIQNAVRCANSANAG